jgi:SulP family sulfate permease
VVYPITGAFFFGAASAIGSVLDGIADSHQVLVIDVGGMPFLDSSAANTISRIARKARKNFRYLRFLTRSAARC